MFAYYGQYHFSFLKNSSRIQGSFVFKVVSDILAPNGYVLFFFFNILKYKAILYKASKTPKDKVIKLPCTMSY